MNVMSPLVAQNGKMNVVIDQKPSIVAMGPIPQSHLQKILNLSRFSEPERYDGD
jgi:hypothetical protein